MCVCVCVCVCDVCVCVCVCVNEWISVQLNTRVYMTYMANLFVIDFLNSSVCIGEQIACDRNKIYTVKYIHELIFLYDDSGLQSEVDVKYRIRVNNCVKKSLGV